MKNFACLFLLGFLLFASCKDDGTLGGVSTVNLNFTALYSGEPLVTNNAAFQYKYPDGREISFNTFNFFISDVALLEAEGSDEAPLIDIDFVDFGENTTAEDALNPITISKNNVPSGNYKGLKISIGVPQDLNNSSFNQLSSTHPLRKHDGEWWSGWDSFIFLKIGGSYDKDDDGLGIGEDASITHHLGSNPIFRTITIPAQITLAAGETFDLNVVTDLMQLYLDENGQHLDISVPENRITHDPDNLDVANYIVNNLGRAMTIE